MSQTELQRFATAIKNQSALAERYTAAATPADPAMLMRADGYDVTDDEVTAVLQRNGELTDSQLDAVAGGFSEDFFAAFREAGRRHWNR